MAFKTLIAILASLLIGVGACGVAQAKDRYLPPRDKFSYEEVTMETLSQLYWAIGKMDLEKDLDVDNFLMINECDIFKEYSHNEFEWREVRESGRDYIKHNKKNFPLRLQFTQLIKLKDYDFDRKGFNVLEKYQILGTRRFEVMAISANEVICGQRGGDIEGYPLGMIVELSRPFSLLFVPVGIEKAEEYISEKIKLFKKYSKAQQTQENLYEARDAYLVMKIKVFSYKGIAHTRESDVDLANVLAVLEGYEIYADLEKENLLYAQSFRRRKKPTKAEQKMFEEYQRTRKTTQEIMTTEEAEKPQVAQ